jgi:phage regulator Rha-like protein
MNVLSIFKSNSAEKTMSSLEIADLTGKRHDNIMRDIRIMLEELYGSGGVLRFEDTHTNPQNGQSYPIFRLPQRIYTKSRRQEPHLMRWQQTDKLDGLIFGDLR